MKIVFFGLGSIGKRQARLIKDNFGFELLAYRSSSKSEKNDLGIEEVYDLNDVLKWGPDIAFITNPTSEHIEYAIFCAKNGIDMFIEKPLSNNEERIQELLEEVKKNNVKTYLAYCLRFHPAINWVKNYLKENKPVHVTVNASSYLPSWRPGINHLENYSAIKDLGGGVIADLSHEIDYLYYLFGDVSYVKSNSGRAGEVTVDSEDFADILLKFEKGLYGNLHMNFLSRLNRREVIIDFKDSTVVVDLNDNKIVIKKDADEEMINFDLERDNYFLSQLTYFFDNLNKDTMMNNIDEAMNVFNVIMDIKKEEGI